MKRSRSNASRRRSRRPKFMSLRDKITAAEDEQKGESSSAVAAAEDEGNVDVAHRFFTGEEGCATTLTGLLMQRPREEAEEEESSPMSSVSAAYGVDGKSLVKAAMRRSREREEEVRWVRMSEVVSEEVSSRAVEDGDAEETRWLGRWRDGGAGAGGGGLALKLDYKEVEEAWDGCGKGRPVFAWPAPDSASTATTIEGAQVVPDLRLHDEFFYHHDLNAANGVLWGVPDPMSCIQHGVEGNGDQQSIEGWRLGQREASVLRYKEKRMNRLFSKRIRYEVRKLNAEKRPRVKGRFVKRS